MAQMQGRPPRFHPFRPPKAPAMEKQEDRYRGSSRERGYTSRWTGAALAYREKHPFCRLCEQEGRVGLAKRVDHIFPAKEYPKLFWERKNWEGLCVPHDNLKQRMENYARANGCLDQIGFWCEAVENRPQQFRHLTAVDLKQHSTEALDNS